MSDDERNALDVEDAEDIGDKPGAAPEEDGIDLPHEEGAEGDVVFDLRLTGDRQAVVVDFMDPGSNIAPIIYRMEKGLEKLELGYVPPREGLEAWLDVTLEAGPPFINLRLLEGDAPVDPVDGYIEWQEDYFAEGFVEDGHDSVDYMQRAEKLSVHEGELLAVLHPPVDGQPGVDLFDQPISVPSPDRASMSSGANVRKVENEDGTVSYYSEINGRLRWVSEVLSVDDVYAVAGDVGLATGDINHSGALVVAGDIKSGTNVNVEGDILVKGMVEPCDIVCGGNIEVEGGIIGSEEHSIIVKGGLQARYVSEAVVEAHGDVVVLNEILNSRIQTLGSVEIPDGRIIGGKISAHVEIVAGQAGSEARVPTRLTCGFDFQLATKLEEPKAKLAEWEEALAESETIVARAMQGTEPLPEAEFDGIMKRHDKIETSTIKQREVVDKIVAASEGRSKFVIIVANEIYSEVLFQIKTGRKLTKRHIKSARRVTCRQGDLRLQPFGFKS